MKDNEIKEILAKHSENYKYMLDNGRENGPGQALIKSSECLNAMKELVDILLKKIPDECDTYVLNEYGLKMWRHKTNKKLLLQQSYSSKDNLVWIDDTDGRKIVGTSLASRYDFSDWEPITKSDFVI